MIKRRSLIAKFAFVLVLSLTLICGITLLGRTITTYAEDDSSSDSDTPTYYVILPQGTLEANGKTSTSTGQGVAQLYVREGDVVTIIAPERSDAVFEKWTYSAVVSVTFENVNSTTTTFVMPKGDIWLDCKYKLIRSVTVENGILEGGATSEKYVEGETVKITAEATLGGKEFLKWVVTLGEVTLVDENSTTTSFVMPAQNVKISALYKSEHTLDLVKEKPATCTENGIRKHYVCKDEGCGRKFMDEFETEEITDDSVLIIPMAHKFGAWIEEVPATEEATGTKAHKTCEFCHNHFDKDGNKIEDLTLYKTYSVILRQGMLEANGKTSTSTGQGVAQLYVREGDVVTIIAPEKSDAVFEKWTYSAVVSVKFANVNSAKTTFVMPKGDIWLECEYKLIRSVTIENGILEGGKTSETFKAGQTVTIIANEAPEGKEFDKWVVISGDVTLVDVNSATTTFVMPDGEVKIKATYKDKTSGGEISETVDPNDGIIPNENGLNGGAIAGIVIGSVVVVGLGGFAIFWFVIKKKSFAELIATIKGK